MWKIGGGFWPFLAGKRAGSDSEVLATLQNEVFWDFNFQHKNASGIGNSAAKERSGLQI